MRNIVRIIPLFCLLFLASCHGRVLYSHVHDLPVEEWHADSVLTFAYTPIDSVADYSIRFVVKHTNQYPYQNLWMFVHEYQDSICTMIDTIECYLADDYGRWYGKGVSSYELPLVYQEPVSYHFPNTIHTITLQQGMRSELVKGIQSVGIEVVRINHRN